MSKRRDQLAQQGIDVSSANALLEHVNEVVQAWTKAKAVATDTNRKPVILSTRPQLLDHEISLAENTIDQMAAMGDSQMQQPLATNTSARQTRTSRNTSHGSDSQPSGVIPGRPNPQRVVVSRERRSGSLLTNAIAARGLMPPPHRGPDNTPHARDAGHGGATLAPVDREQEHAKILASRAARRNSLHLLSHRRRGTYTPRATLGHSQDRSTDPAYSTSPALRSGVTTATQRHHASHQVVPRNDQQTEILAANPAYSTPQIHRSGETSGVLHQQASDVSPNVPQDVAAQGDAPSNPRRTTEAWRASRSAAGPTQAGFRGGNVGTTDSFDGPSTSRRAPTPFGSLSGNSRKVSPNRPISRLPPTTPSISRHSGPPARSSTATPSRFRTSANLNPQPPSQIQRVAPGHFGAQPINDAFQGFQYIGGQPLQGSLLDHFDTIYHRPQFEFSRFDRNPPARPVIPFAELGPRSPGLGRIDSHEFLLSNVNEQYTESSSTGNGIHYGSSIGMVHPRAANYIPVSEHLHGRSNSDEDLESRSTTGRREARR